jgi:2-hydroxy-3-keto-5-methylthiopentenyl-1-phosphate phosphatase
MDFYINGIFASRGITVDGVFSNHAIVNDGRIAVTFPFAQEHCVITANCKCSHVMRLTADNDTIVYIGNGTSDMCPSECCDVVFAKQRLAKHCDESNIPYHNFHSFNDITPIIEKHLRRTRPYKRSAAEVKRRELLARE